MNSTTWTGSANDYKHALVGGRDYLTEEVIRRVYETMALPLPQHHRYASAAITNEGASMPATTMNLYEVLIIDSRLDDDDADVLKTYYVRSTSSEDAKLRALLRSQYDERDIKYLDIVARVLIAVKPYVGSDD